MEIEYEDLVEWIEPFDPPAFPSGLLAMQAAIYLGLAAGAWLAFPA